MFDLAIDSKRRGCDLLKLKIGDPVGGLEVRTRATITERITRRSVQFEIPEGARESLFTWLELQGGAAEEFVFPSRVDNTRHLSTRQYARLVDESVDAIGLRLEEDGTHSLRRIKASIIYKATGNIRAIQLMLGHSKIENRVRYLGVDIEDALNLAEKVKICNSDGCSEIMGDSRAG